ncbi:GntR family transcriptional regulator [Phytomonospora endophytica]|uniref:DNA-binding LacI/PurR family transcriptional regulator n=1 Tax=Phytomonospora endophytica TaxID=714109 RepID=A0A841FIQ0_9ACTN|nr:GntR family transcriptional regulator [Phytomonospora endophytica]MBB6033442.1 DNA-binding LacI/PurR family transcriptional regulator [Phytomonospora endophytica]GIG65039.1 LacI family transcriptional regulator [Phytomonospora endophytica]
MGAPLLYAQICDFVLAEIRAGSLTPGARVPSEMELAERFEVSRITSKRALEILREAGVIDRIRGKGSFVVPELPDLDTLDLAGTGRSKNPTPSPAAIALVIPDVSDAYGLELLCGIEERCAEHGISLIVRRTRGLQDVEEEVIESLVDTGRADGLIVFPVHGEYYNASLLRVILGGSPLVLVDRYLSGIPACAVHTDNEAAAHALTEKLLRQGHRHIGFVSSPPANTSSIEERLTGYRAAYTRHGLPTTDQRLLTEMRGGLPGAFTPDIVAADVDRVAEYHAANPDITAYMVCEYNLARIVERALNTPDGTTKPVITCFDTPPDPIDGPRFTHIRQGQRAMGRTAVDHLLAQLRGEDVPKQTTVPFELIEAGD